MVVWCVLYECDGQKCARYTSVSGVFVYIGAVCGWYVCSVCIYTYLRVFVLLSHGVCACGKNVSCHVYIWCVFYICELCVVCLMHPTCGFSMYVVVCAYVVFELSHVNISHTYALL